MNLKSNVLVMGLALAFAACDAETLTIADESSSADAAADTDSATTDTDGDSDSDDSNTPSDDAASGDDDDDDDDASPADTTAPTSDLASSYTVDASGQRVINVTTSESVTLVSNSITSNNTSLISVANIAVSPSGTTTTVTIDASDNSSPETVDVEIGFTVQDAAGNQLAETTTLTVGGYCTKDGRSADSPYANSDDIPTGASSDPFRICTATQFFAINDDINASGNDTDGIFYELMDDLDLEGVRADLGSGNEGYIDGQFRGDFDGNDQTISNVDYDEDDENGGSSKDVVGLFAQLIDNDVSDLDLVSATSGNSYDAYIDESSTESDGFVPSIHDLTIENASIAARSSVGALVGSCYTSVVRNITITGTVVVRGTSSSIGGAIGYSEGCLIDNLKIDDAKFYVHSEANTVGGLVGWAGYYDSGGVFIRSHITDSFVDTDGLPANDSNTAIASGYALFAADSDGTPFSINATKQPNTNGIVAGAATRIGGLVGQLDDSTVTQSASNTNVLGYASSGSALMGGLVGNGGTSANEEKRKVIISQSYATGSVLFADTSLATNNGNWVGGLVGLMNCSGSTVPCLLEDSYATGRVEGVENVAGLIGGPLTMIVRRSYSTGDVFAHVQHAGGVIGQSNWYDDGVYGNFTASNVDLSANDSNAAPIMSWDDTDKDGGYNYIVSGSTCQYNTDATPTNCSYNIGSGNSIALADLDDTSGQELFTMDGTPDLSAQAWDFSTVWEAQTDTYPTLREAPATTALSD